jgi:hypothetical protein
MQYYRRRKVWLIEPDVLPARISPYPALLPREASH